MLVAAVVHVSFLPLLNTKLMVQGSGKKLQAVPCSSARLPHANIGRR